MKKVLKLTAALLAALVLGAGLVACSSSDDDDDDNKSSANPYYGIKAAKLKAEVTVEGKANPQGKLVMQAQEMVSWQIAKSQAVSAENGVYTMELDFESIKSGSAFNEGWVSFYDGTIHEKVSTYSVLNWYIKSCDDNGKECDGKSACGWDASDASAVSFETKVWYQEPESSEWKELKLEGEYRKALKTESDKGEKFDHPIVDIGIMNPWADTFLAGWKEVGLGTGDQKDDEGGDAPEHKDDTTESQNKNAGIDFSSGMPNGITVTSENDGAKFEQKDGYLQLSAGGSGSWYGYLISYSDGVNIEGKQMKITAKVSNGFSFNKDSEWGKTINIEALDADGDKQSFFQLGEGDVTSSDAEKTAAGSAAWNNKGTMNLKNVKAIAVYTCENTGTFCIKKIEFVDAE